MTSAYLTLYEGLLASHLGNTTDNQIKVLA
jgi:hypothetical protein